jgi:hypothetical protein
MSNFGIRILNLALFGQDFFEGVFVAGPSDSEGGHEARELAAILTVDRGEERFDLCEC